MCVPTNVSDNVYVYVLCVPNVCIHKRTNKGD